MNESHVTSTSRRSRTSTPWSPGGVAVLETELAELRKLNSHLRRRLEEAERDAELRIRAQRILAIPLSRHD